MGKLLKFTKATKRKRVAGLWLEPEGDIGACWFTEHKGLRLCLYGPWGPMNGWLCEILVMGQRGYKSLAATKRVAKPATAVRQALREFKHVYEASHSFHTLVLRSSCPWLFKGDYR